MPGGKPNEKGSSGLSTPFLSVLIALNAPGMATQPPSMTSTSSRSLATRVLTSRGRATSQTTAPRLRCRGSIMASAALVTVTITSASRRPSSTELVTVTLFPPRSVTSCATGLRRSVFRPMRVVLAACGASKRALVWPILPLAPTMATWAVEIGVPISSAPFIAPSTAVATV